MIEISYSSEFGILFVRVTKLNFISKVKDLYNQALEMLVCPETTLFF